MTKRVLCYGDSNTWGQTASRTRLDEAKQWPNILWRALGEDYWVIQEGLSGRVAGNYETTLALNGQPVFEATYYIASPVDLVIVALGTNDFKKKYGRSARDIANDLLWYKQAIQDYAELSEGRNTQLLYLCPADFTPTEGYFEVIDGVREELVEIMRSFDAPILELNDLEMSSDGIHYSEAAHQEVARRVKEKIEEMLA